MYQLFTKQFDSANSVIKPGGFDYLQRTYQREILNINDYYNNRVYAIKSNHLLCRLLQSANVPHQYEIDRFMEAAYARSPYISKHFKFTSDINYGIFHQGIFYGDGVDELIIYDESYFNPYEAIINWKNIQAVKVLEHPVSSLGLLIPNGKRNTTSTGLAVISIDIPLLLIQYRGFCSQQFLKVDYEENADSLLAVTHFLHMYVLPNMLYSHIELVIRNRLMNLFYGAPMDVSLAKHPFPVINYDDKLDKCLLTIIKHIKDTNMQYFSMLKNIPSIFVRDCQAALQMPDMAKTRQVWWALLLTRLNTMKFLLDIGGSKGISNNKSFINKLQIDIKRLLDENLIESMLPEDMYFDTKETLLEILDI